MAYGGQTASIWAAGRRNKMANGISWRKAMYENGEENEEEKSSSDQSLAWRIMGVAAQRIN